MANFAQFTTILRPLAILALAAVLPGCVAMLPAAAVYGGVEGISLNQTDKLMSDHVVSAVTGQDCSFLKYKDTGIYCRSAAEIAEQAAKERRDLSAYCYRRRGMVTCYDSPDPTATAEIQIMNQPLGINQTTEY
jgi:hypothetical protein